MLAHTQAYSIHILGQRNWGCGWSQFRTLMHPNVPSTHPGQIPEMTPAGMVYNGKCATDQAQRRGVKRSAGPYTGLFDSHPRATELGMRVESVSNIDAPQCALHSPRPNSRDDPSRHGVQWKVCNRSGPTPWSETECWPIHRPIRFTSWGNRTGDAGGVSFEHQCTPICHPLTWAKYQR